MSTILFLDDDPIRTEAFLRTMHGGAHAITTVTTAAECIETLRSGRFDVVCLDHDLGGEIFVESEREDCGMEVVRYIARHRPAIGGIVVHSFNTIASESMAEQLLQAGYVVGRVPFGRQEFYRAIDLILRRYPSP